MIKAVLFDLDGTLLPMDQDLFIKTYFSYLAKKLAPYGYESKKLIGAILAGTDSMIKNDGNCTNEEAFWQTFCKIFGKNAKNDMPYFDEFYSVDFAKIRAVCGYTPKAKECVYHLKEQNIQVVLATNPIFPAVATQQRIQFAGLEPNDFELFTTYENSRFCKPNLKYYQDIISHLGLKAEECVMVGNDVSDDMVTAKMGMKVFLLTDCLMNKDNVDISAYPNGNFDDLITYLKTVNE